MACHKRQNVSCPNNPQPFFLYVSAELNRAHEAGAVQQDIRAGNALLIENCLEPERLVGFVVDCDYAALSEEALRVLRDVVKPRPHRHFLDQDRRTKGSTGTPSFMALAMLQKNPTAKHALGHDLESLYWLLIWLCLRHTEHRLGPRRFSGLFNTVCLFVMRSSSLFREEDYAPSGSPWWSLTSDFQDLVMAQNLSGKPPTALKPSILPGPRHILYSDVQSLFDQALALKTWPVGGRAPPCKLPNDGDKRAELDLINDRRG
ncbi:unnamed protein product [Mycena citricolor]|uniref:Fungal-type protein kinase domain-containing protein n=1 Tax=Mycena citricolor TaxID=2018698 RepID=A0AAD2GT17_9AGAR|nr:unnamed protein product [Mycena citricolor]